MSDQTPPGMPDIFPWLEMETVLPPPPMGSREDLALRLHARIERIHRLLARIAELENAPPKLVQAPPPPLAFRFVMGKLRAAIDSGEISKADQNLMLAAVGMPPEELAPLVLPSQVVRLAAFNALLDLKLSDCPAVIAPKPAHGHAHCGRCGSHFLLRKNQRHHTGKGHRVYCSVACRAAVYPS
jgi:hypothetical protein